tara:strand:+ start:685 stop:1491 length:807 start_codon:yes stop_codon:yes gene_type:complete
MKVVLGGCARDIANDIEISLNDMIKVGEECSDYVIIVYENDSVDRTLDILQQYARANSRIIVLSEKKVPGSRTERLAHGRNMIVNMIRRDYRQFDFFINMDMDYSQPIAFSFMDILPTWKEEWNVLTAVSRERYYDWWAFRSKDLLPYDCWDSLENKDGDCYAIDKKYSLNMPKRITRVDSAFNGIGVYRIQRIVDSNCVYVGRIGDTDKCEHVEFNKCIGNVYIHPSIITQTWEENWSILPKKRNITPLVVVLVLILVVGYLTWIHK